MSDLERCPEVDAIAVIGVACRLPGANSVDEFWQNLANGVESIIALSDEQLKSGGQTELLRDPSYVKASPVLGDVGLFDAQFFNCPPREAELMDPQHRLFLESAWEALETAGYASEQSGRRIAVYSGQPVRQWSSSIRPASIGPCAA